MVRIASLGLAMGVMCVLCAGAVPDTGDLDLGSSDDAHTVEHTLARAREATCSVVRMAFPACLEAVVAKPAKPSEERPSVGDLVKPWSEPPLPAL